jgi:polysaccharide export outer membrane protein
MPLKTFFRLSSMVAIVGVSSCVDLKKAVYFNDTYNQEIASAISNLEPVIQKNDLLSISVTSLLPAATEVSSQIDNRISAGTSINK